MNSEKRLGIRNFVYSCIGPIIAGLILIIVANRLPEISRFFIEISGTHISSVNADLINRVGNILTGALFLLSFVIIIFGVLINVLHHMSTTYELMDNAFKMRKGLISRDEILIPYKQIQAVNIDQSIWHRIIGLANLSVLSAGNTSQGGESDEVFKNVDIPVAKYLQTELLKRSNIQEVVEVKG